MNLNRRNFIALLGLSPTAMLLKPDLSEPIGKRIQGQSVDMVIIDELPSYVDMIKGAMDKELDKCRQDVQRAFYQEEFVDLVCTQPRAHMMIKM